MRSRVICSCEHGSVGNQLYELTPINDILWSSRTGIVSQLGMIWRLCNKKWHSSVERTTTSLERVLTHPLSVRLSFTYICEDPGILPEEKIGDGGSSGEGVLEIRESWRSHIASYYSKVLWIELCLFLRGQETEQMFIRAVPRSRDGRGLEGMRLVTA